MKTIFAVLLLALTLSFPFSGLAETPAQASVQPDIKGNISRFSKPIRFVEVPSLELSLPSAFFPFLELNLGVEVLGKIQRAKLRKDGQVDLLRQVDHWNDPPGSLPSRGNVFQRAATQGKGAGYFLPWAYFPSNFVWGQRILGDFNGDGYQEILLHGSGLAGWWIALSNGETGLEMPVLGLEDILPGQNITVVFDFNEDGAEDLLFVSRASGEFRQFTLGAPAELPPFCIRLDQAECVFSDQSGAFSLPAPTVPGSHEIRLERAGWSFSPERRFLTVSSGGDGESEAVLHFVAVENVGADGVIGRSQQLGTRPPGPAVCIDYTSNQSINKWSSVGDAVCPEHFAFYGVASPENKGDLAKVLSNGDCCRLPAEDILVGEPIYEATECPDGFIASGFRSDGNCPSCLFRLQCRKVNDTRYQLGPLHPGTTVGISRGKNRWSSRVDRDFLPAAIRDGLGRDDYDVWVSHSCVGLPYGSLYVKKGMSSCENLGFRQLQYRGAPGDPAQGTPVQMYPDCDRIENPYDPTTGCYPSKR